jgi:predicted HicB family RNase H-like nuclease
MVRKDEFDGFSIELFRDDEGDWLAHFEELPNVSAFGNSPAEALEELKEAWIAMKESYLSRNEPVPLAPSKKEYSGQFNVRIDRRVHRALAVEAARAGVSLNSLVSQKLSLSAKI